jgi:hypothetical protein
MRKEQKLALQSAGLAAILAAIFLLPMAGTLVTGFDNSTHASRQTCRPVGHRTSKHRVLAAGGTRTRSTQQSLMPGWRLDARKSNPRFSRCVRVKYHFPTGRSARVALKCYIQYCAELRSLSHATSGLLALYPV